MGEPRGFSVALFLQPIQKHEYADAGKGHEDGGDHKVGNSNHYDPGNEWDLGALFLAEYEQARADGSPKQRGKKKTGA